MTEFPEQLRTIFRRAKGSAVAAAGLALGLWAAPAAAEGPYAIYTLEGVVFDDGGRAEGGFDFHMIPFGVPQFYNFSVQTIAGTMLLGSEFTSSTYCWINDKKPPCAPGDDLLVTLTNGVPAGQPGYDAFQFAGWYAPNATMTVVLDKAVNTNSAVIFPRLASCGTSFLARSHCPR